MRLDVEALVIRKLVDEPVVAKKFVVVPLVTNSLFTDSEAMVVVANVDVPVTTN